MRSSLLAVVLLAGTTAFGQKVANTFGISPNATESSIFSEGVISTASEFAITFTPDSRTAYFTRFNRANKTTFIFESQYSDADVKWQTPFPVSFSGKEW